MEKTNRELTQLEYLIRFRAISYNTQKCYLYLSLKQALAFVAVMQIMAGLEANEQTTATMSEVITEAKIRLDKGVKVYRQSFGPKIGNTYSKEAIRAMIYLCFPLYLNVTQQGRPKILSLTPKARDFIEWQFQGTGDLSKAEDMNWYKWLKGEKNNFCEGGGSD